MAKKRDILSNYFNDFHNYKQAYKTRLEEIKRDFNNEKIIYDDMIKQIAKDYSNDQNLYLSKYITEEKEHQHRKDVVDFDYQDRFDLIAEELENNHRKIANQIDEENKIFQDVMIQFEERKQVALDHYLQLIHESDREIDESVNVHTHFIETESGKTKALKEYYQDVNNFLANDLLNTMEKAKNALDTLNESLKDTNLNESQELNQTVLKSIENLRGTQFDIIALFKDNSNNLENRREDIKKISKTKQRPHSELNQKMIQKYVTQIREVNQNKVAFEAKVKSDLDNSLKNLYMKIIKAHDEKDDNSLRKYIQQKAIIEKKADYLLHRNTTLSNFTISKYQQEIKKIKIDSFKRSEEVKLAYSLPIAFLQNSIDTYSNFAFYLNQGFDELDRLLSSLIDFNQDYLDTKTNFITTTSKAYEDYKINLMVRVNEVTNNLTKLVARIDDISLQIVTLESRNRLEIAELRKKMENLEILGDYQKYLASLENDEFFAMYQHSKNIEKIQVEGKYTENLLLINQDVLELNKNKELAGEHLQYMLNLSKEEQAIHKLSFEKLISEFEAFYNQQNKMSFLMHKMAKLRIIDEIKTKNYQYAKRYLEIKKSELDRDRISSDNVVDFVHHMQKLINTNNSTTAAFKKYLSDTKNEFAYLKIVEKNRDLLLKQIDDQLKKKISACYQAASLYYKETSDLTKEIKTLLIQYIDKLKHLLLYNENNYLSYHADIVKNKGYSLEISSVIDFVYSKAINQAYKYQVPEIIETLVVYYEEVKNDFNSLSTSIFEKIKSKTRSKTFYNKIQEYLIESLKILNRYEKQIIIALENIRDKISEKDLLFIASAKLQAQDNKKVINDEYDLLAYEAIRVKAKRKKQTELLIDYSNNFNEMFKKRVKNINNEYVNQSNKTKDFLEYLESALAKVITENDAQLVKMLKLIDKEMFEERLRFTNQYKKYLHTIESIRANLSNAHNNEVKYLYDLNFERENDIIKTIKLLEEKIDYLPKERTNIITAIAQQKQDLFLVKQDELLSKYAEIEESKLISKPELILEIERVHRRLPEDYVRLYKEVQELENEFLQQYTLVNEDYYETYQDYINKQMSNRILLDNDSKIFKSFDWLNTYHKDLLHIFQLNYKETQQKSIDTRDIIKTEKKKSKEKQDRIINA